MPPLTTLPRAALALAMLISTACAGTLVPAPGGNTTAAMQRRFADNAVALTARARIALPHRGSAARAWMARNATQIKRLLYVSSFGDGTVDVYDYDSGAMVGTLSGFVEPSGQCVDRNGDVFIADFGGDQISEYAHGASSPSATFADPDALPIGCSVDDTTGALAVANFMTSKCPTCGGPGNLVIFTIASKPPTHYRSRFYYLWPPAYDDHGNLFIEGRVVKTFDNGVDELPRGGSRLRTVAFTQKIWLPGGAQWDGAHVLITDQDYNESNTTGVYQTTVHDFRASVAGSTQLDDFGGSECFGSGSDVVSPFVVIGNAGASRIIGGNIACEHVFDYWRYPEGGDPIVKLQAAPLAPYGQSVSVAPK